MFLQPNPLFMEACESSVIGVYLCQKNTVLQMIPKERVSQNKRVIKIDQKQNVIYLTILHNHEKVDIYELLEMMCANDVGIYLK